MLPDSNRRTGLCMKIEGCRNLEGVWWAKIRAANLATRNFPTAAYPPPSICVLYVPAALAVRARPSCLQQLQTAACRAYHVPFLRPEPVIIDLTSVEDAIANDVIDLTGTDQDDIIDLT